MADNLAIIYERAKVLQAKRCHDDAIKELNNLIELAEQFRDEQDSLKRLLARAWNDRGHLKYLQVDFYGAEDDFTQAIKLDNDFAVPFYNRGQIHYRMGTQKSPITLITDFITTNFLLTTTFRREKKRKATTMTK